MSFPEIGMKAPSATEQVFAICERVAEVQALLDDHIAGGKHTAADVIAKAQAVLTGNPSKEDRLKHGQKKLLKIAEKAGKKAAKKAARKRKSKSKVDRSVIFHLLPHFLRSAHPTSVNLRDHARGSRGGESEPCRNEPPAASQTGTTLPALSGVAGDDDGVSRHGSAPAISP